MRRVFFLLTVLTVTTSSLNAQLKGSGYPTDPVPFTNVKVVENSFWGQRLKASREVTIPLAFSKCQGSNHTQHQ